MSIATLENIPYNAGFAREQFLFYEMRITARFMIEGLKDNEILERICSENLFQYPTERNVRRIAKGCITRLKLLEDMRLVKAIAEEPQDIVKQICLYAMMKQFRVVAEFMITVIGAKFRTGDLNFSKVDINLFYAGLIEQSDTVASWSDSTIKKHKSLLAKLLVDNEYLDSSKSDKLNPVWINPVLENAIREKGEEAFLPAFNRFE